MTKSLSNQFKTKITQLTYYYYFIRLRVAKAPRLLVHSLSDSKNVLVVPALLQHFENCYRHTLSCVTIFSNSAYSPEEAIVQVIYMCNCFN